MISIMEPSLVEQISVTKCLEQVHQPHWFRLLRIWRKEAVILSTTSRKSKGASSKSIPEGRAFALADVRHQRSSPLISGQGSFIFQVSRHLETCREWFNNPLSAARRIQARHPVTDCISQVPPKIKKTQNQERWIGNVITGC